MKALLSSFFFIVCLAVSAEKNPVQLRNFLFLNKAFESGKMLPFDLADSNPEGRINDFLGHVRANKADEQLKKLENFRLTTELNDWLYFKLIRQLSTVISPADLNNRALYTWYFLSRSGYDARIVTQDKHIHVFVHSRDSVYEDSYFNLGRQMYIRLPVNTMPDEYTSFSFYNFKFIEAIRAFSFNDSRPPLYRATQIEEKQISFQHAGKDYSYTLKTDREMRRLYSDKPNTGLRYTFTTALTPIAYASLIPQIKADLKDMDTYKGVQFLLSLTRNSFEYKNDVENGVEYYMTAEETLLAEESDCEDRAALFYYLVREIYQLPMLVLLYPHHVTVAVNFGQNAYGKPVIFKGGKYSICEPTGPGNELEIGEAPDFTENQNYSIMLHYNPGN